MKNKLLIPIIAAASSVLIFGTAYAAWVFGEIEVMKIAFDYYHGPK